MKDNTQHKEYKHGYFLTQENKTDTPSYVYLGSTLEDALTAYGRDTADKTFKLNKQALNGEVEGQFTRRVEDGQAVYRFEPHK